MLGRVVKENVRQLNTPEDDTAAQALHIQGMGQPMLVVSTQKEEVWSCFCKLCMNREKGRANIHLHSNSRISCDTNVFQSICIKKKKKARGMTKAELDFS